jgi:hypothetical protein
MCRVQELKKKKTRMQLKSRLREEVESALHAIGSEEVESALHAEGSEKADEEETRSKPA